MIFPFSPRNKINFLTTPENLENIINLIVEESGKIGTLQPQVAEELKSMFDHEGKWLNFNNYKKWK